MKFFQGFLFVVFICLTIYSSWGVEKRLVSAEEDEIAEDQMPKVDVDIGKSRDGSKTDDEVVEREEEAIKLDGLSVAQLKEMRAGAEKQEFVAEVNRMMKLIINSLYKNKDIFLRELISNASDALDKIRFMSLTDQNILGETQNLDVRIRADKENSMLHITDTGVGMTKSDLIKYLGTIAKSQTSEFFNKVQEAQNNKDTGSMSDLIGQFGVGFYSAFLVADKVVVTSKHNDDDQHIWESDANSFITSKDPRGNTLGRGTTVSLHMKEEGAEFLEEHKLKEIITKYSQFITFNIYLWTSKSVEEEVPIEETETATKAPESDDDATVEEAKTEEKPKTKKVTKTVYDWELMNSAKPIWQRKASDITDDEYRQFYKAFSKDTQDYLTSTHFSAEGEVSFKSILFVPKIAPSDIFQNYNKPSDNSLKLYVRRVFISDNVDDLVPKYLSFIRGIVDSDDLPLNVSRETLQQSKLLKVIKKKIVRKILDMIKKLSEEDFATFWKEYGTNIKLGVIEDNSNKNRLSHLLRFHSSNDDTKLTSLDEYMKRMKTDQANIFFIAGTNKDALAKSPFVERILKKGYEVLYCVDPIDEYTLQSIPEFEGKRLQNVAKDGLKLDKSKAAEDRQKELETAYAPLVSWIKEGSLKQFVENVKVSSRLVQTPMALVASQYGYSGNMERITRAQAYQKSGGDSTQHHFASQKKILEINPGHPLIKELLKLVEGDANSQRADDLVNLMFEAATIRSGYELRDTAGFADRIETMMRSALNISPDEKVDEMPDFDESVAEEAAQEQPDEVNADEEPEVKAEHEEL